MAKYVCENCDKSFNQKGHLNDHNNRKRPCKKDNTIEILVEKKIKEVLLKTNEVQESKSITSESDMDYSKKTREELISICKEKGIKGYSGKRKEDIRKLLTPDIKSEKNIPTLKDTLSCKNTNKIRYIDLFCGLGAFHTAFNISDRFECVLACDIDDGVRNIYKSNYGIEPKKDIRSISPIEIPDFEILCAGFPCQPFSIAGNGEGFNDKVKGNLFYDILKIIDVKMPLMCILENVKNLKTHDNGNTYRTIEMELKNRGYLITSKVINAVNYGSPQARQRIFIVATKEKPFVIPEGNGINRPVSEIIDMSINQNDIDFNKYILRQKLVKDIVPGKPMVIYDIMSKTSGKGGRQGERVYSIDSVGITVCASSGGPGAKTGLYKVGNNIRRLTVKETLSMFGFPESYKFEGISQEDSLFYLGNSIVVNIIDAFVPNVLSWFPIEQY